MTKKKLVEKVTEVWKELNSDVSKSEKQKLLEQLSRIVHIELIFDDSNKKVTFVKTCDVIIEEFKNALEKA